MSKVLDWNANYKGALRGNRGKYGSYRELLQKKEELRQQAVKQEQMYKAIEPLLKQMLMDRMLGREVIKVLAPFKNLEDKLVKGSYQTVYAPIEPGTKLIYDHWDKTMGQWIFRTQANEFGKSEEVAIYDKPVLTVGIDPSGQPIQQLNTGFYGLLTKTDIYEAAVKVMAKAEESEDEES